MSPTNPTARRESLGKIHDAFEYMEYHGGKSNKFYLIARIDKFLFKMWGSLIEGRVPNHRIEQETNATEAMRKFELFGYSKRKKGYVRTRTVPVRVQEAAIVASRAIVPADRVLTENKKATVSRGDNTVAGEITRRVKV